MVKVLVIVEVITCYEIFTDYIFKAATKSVKILGGENFQYREYRVASTRVG